MSYSFSEFNTHKIYPNYGVNMYSFAKQNSVTFAQNKLDTFETKDNVSFTGKTKRNVLLASGGALAIGSVAFLLNRRMTLEKAQKIFQNTFMNNDISLDDTSKMIAEFKAISKIDDVSDYIKALFDSARKHYGLEHLDLKLSIEDLGVGKLGAMDAGNTLHVSKNAKRNKLVEIIFHEFRHAKQNDLMATSDLERYIQCILNRRTTDEVLQNTEKFKRLVANADRTRGLKDEDAIKKQVLDYMKDEMAKSSKGKFEAMGYGLSELPKLDNLDEFLEKCFNAHNNYNDRNPFAYFFNFLEKDAREAASGICAVFRNLGKL